jgi:LysR family hydrogen peroxide-inducible transcriptional activator
LQFRRAAEQLGISQPSLSLQINAFETAIGARLLERRRSGLILTPAGREVAHQAERILREVEALGQVAAPRDDSLTGTMRLGSSPTVGPYLLPRVLRRLHLHHPELKLVIRDGTPRALAEDLLAGMHDMILTQLPLSGADLRIRPLFREPLHLATARDHALADRDHIRHSDLANEHMLNLSPAYPMHRQITALAETAGAVLRDDLEGTSLDALRQMVSLGMGVTLLPALYVQSEVARTDADVQIVPLRPTLHRQIGLAWRAASGQPAAFTRISDLIREIVAKDFGDLVRS